MSATDVGAEPCECSIGAPIPGVLGWQTPAEGVERCDACAFFTSDLHAAYALANHLGKAAWFMAIRANDPKAKPFVARVTVRLLGEINWGTCQFIIQPGTDPWVIETMHAHSRA